MVPATTTYNLLPRGRWLSLITVMMPLKEMRKKIEEVKGGFISIKVIWVSQEIEKELQENSFKWTDVVN